MSICRYVIGFGLGKPVFTNLLSEEANEDVGIDVCSYCLSLVRVCEVGFFFFLSKRDGNTSSLRFFVLSIVFILPDVFDRWTQPAQWYEKKWGKKINKLFNLLQDGSLFYDVTLSFVRLFTSRKSSGGRKKNVGRRDANRLKQNSSLIFRK